MTSELVASAVLEASGLTKTYGTTVALAGVDLVVPAGESVAIMGASGSGKTTLLHCLAGIVTPDAGTVRLSTPAGPVLVNTLGDAQRSALRRSMFGFVFQQGLLIPELTAVENVAMPLMLGGMPRSAAEQHAGSWLAALGLAERLTSRIGELSGGQVQRVAIARAQVAAPAVVFADEPTGALDSHTSAEVMAALIGSTTEQGRTLVVVTHDEEVAARCGRVVRLRDGRIVESRTRVGTTGEMQLIETPDAGGSGVAGGSSEAARPEAPRPEASRPTASGTVTSANGHRR